MMKTQLNIQDFANKLIAITDKKELDTFVFRTLAGPNNRFIRQEIIQHLTGEKHQLVKCGVSYVIQHVQAFQANQQNDLDIALAKANFEQPSNDEVKAEPKEEKLPPYKIEVGTPVIRRKCKRKGVIKANANGKMEIHLEDGSIRRPASSRFYSLYNFSNQ
jgi:hypothetical protein